MRVTVDVDDETRAWEVYHKIKKYTGRKPEVYLSSSGHGFHFIVRGLNITFDESIVIRELCGDDPVRVRLDKITCYKPKAVLWTKKETIDKKGRVRRIKNFEEYFKKKVIITRGHRTGKKS